MKKPQKPDNEDKRLQDLRNFKILDTLPEQCFDDITKVASYICKTPIALISLIDKDRQWFKSKVGLDASETPRDLAFCAHAILKDEVLYVPDSQKDDRFIDNPLVINAPNVKFYAGAPLKSAQGTNLGTLCVIDQKPCSLTKEQLNCLEALARQVVSQMELRLEKINAEMTAKNKSLFLANMSHEIRTPMNGLLSCCKLLEDNIGHQIDDENKKLLYTMQSCGDSLLTILNDILDYSKIEHGKMTLEEYPFNLIQNLEEVIELNRPRASFKNIKINMIKDSRLKNCYLGDVTRIRQIFMNLITNAIKFTKSKVDVNVEILESKNSTDRIKFSIIDDGIGINDAEQISLFHKFKQVNTSTTRKYGGTGLGLAISKWLINAMNGEIHVSSQINEGSNFFFEIQLKQSLIECPVQKDYSSKFDSSLAKNYPHTILVAEDNEINQMVLKKILNKLGYHADIVENGQLAIEQLKKKKYDLIFMDQQMPVMDGVEATKAIRMRDEGKNVFIVAITASALKEDQIRCLDAGMDGFLIKPIVIDSLVSQLIKSFKK